MKKERIYIGVFVLSILAFAIYEWAKPRPVDWTQSYSGLDKVPFGCYIMRDMLPQLYQQENISYQNEPIFTAEWDSTRPRNAIYINGSFAPDKYEAEKLIQQAKAGHSIFIAANNISGKLADTLDIDIDRPSNVSPMNQAGLTTDTLRINFSNSQLQEKNPWLYTLGIQNYHFSAFDTLNTTILGKTDDGDANYIKVERGQGALFLHTLPKVFTNYYVLKKEKADYAFKALSYLPVRPTVWDEYYKLGRSTAGSPMRYIVSHDYLRWGWVTTLIGLLLFMIFRAKRKQRIIPEIKKSKNTSLQFTKTIGRLYHEHGNRKDIAEKKITYFLAYIRSRLRLDTQTIDEEFLSNVSQRSGIEYDIISELFEQISSIQDKTNLSAKELHSINQKIEHFYQETSR